MFRSGEKKDTKRRWTGKGRESVTVRNSDSFSGQEMKSGHMRELSYPFRRTEHRYRTQTYLLRECLVTEKRIATDSCRTQ